MEKVKIFALLLFIPILGIAQRDSDKVFNTIEDAIRVHLEEFSSIYKRVDNIYLQTVFGDSLKVSDKVLQVAYPISCLKGKRNGFNYFIRIVIDQKVDLYQVSITNFRIVNISRRSVNIVNTGNGKTYFIKLKRSVE